MWSNQDIKANHPNCHVGRCHQAATPKKCPSVDKPAAHILHVVPQSPCCRPVMFAVIHRCMCSSVPSLSLFPKAAAALLKSSGSPGPAGAGVAGQGEILGQRAGRSSSRFGRATRRNTITPSLRSFARPLAVHEFAISSALVWWQLTSCKSRRGHWPPLWEQLLTWPLIRRPHMYQTWAECRACRALCLLDRHVETLS